MSVVATSCIACGAWDAQIYPICSRVHPICRPCLFLWREGHFEDGVPKLTKRPALITWPRDDLGDEVADE